jgi:nucleoside-diphosphate kinase
MFVILSAITNKDKKGKSVERTLVILKPDAIQRGIVGDIVQRFERVGLKLVGAKMFQPERELLDQHYPKDRDELILGIAKKTLENYKEQGLDVMADFGTDDPKAVGLKVQEWLVDFMSSSPVLAFVLEGPHAIEVVRKIVGSTLPAKAAPGTIRGDYSFDSSALANLAKRPIRNLVHASGDAKEAEFEINLWFNDDELQDYPTIHQKHMVE